MLPDSELMDDDFEFPGAEKHGFSDLKKYLTDRGITSTGKKKDELLELVVRAQRKYEM